MIKWRLSDPEDDLMFIENPDTGELENYIPYVVIHCETKEDFERFKNAMDKQKAIKPRYTTIFEGEKAEKLKAKNLPNFEIYKCPICNNSVAERTFATSLYPGGFIKDNYCSDCGQKLDWSGTDGL